MAREEELAREGWRKQFMANEPRLSEAVEEYKALGFEVRLEPVDVEEDDGTCKACIKFAPEEFKVIIPVKYSGMVVNKFLYKLHLFLSRS